MKTTRYTNRSLATAWVEQIAPAGKTSKGSFSYKGVDLYSYTTRIARLHKCKSEPNGIALISNRNYSITTRGKHMSPMFRALRDAGMPHLRVPEVDPTGNVTHGWNITYLKQRYLETLLDLSRVRGDREIPSHLIEQAETAGLNIYTYERWFDLPADDTTIFADIAERKAQHVLKTQKWNEPKAVERRLRSRARRDLLRVVAA